MDSWTFGGHPVDDDGNDRGDEAKLEDEEGTALEIASEMVGVCKDFMTGMQKLCGNLAAKLDRAYEVNDELVRDNQEMLELLRQGETQMEILRKENHATGIPLREVLVGEGADKVSLPELASMAVKKMQRYHQKLKTEMTVKKDVQNQLAKWKNMNNALQSDLENAKAQIKDLQQQDQINARKWAKEREQLERGQQVIRTRVNDAIKDAKAQYDKILQQSLEQVKEQHQVSGFLKQQVEDLGKQLTIETSRAEHERQEKMKAQEENQRLATELEAKRQHISSMQEAMAKLQSENDKLKKQVELSNSHTKLLRQVDRSILELRSRYSASSASVAGNSTFTDA